MRGKVRKEKSSVGRRGGFHFRGFEEEEEWKQLGWEGSDGRTVIKASTNKGSAAHWGAEINTLRWTSAFVCVSRTHTIVLSFCLFHMFLILRSCLCITIATVAMVDNTELKDVSLFFSLTPCSYITPEIIIQLTEMCMCCRLMTNFIIIDYFLSNCLVCKVSKNWANPLKQKRSSGVFLEDCLSINQTQEKEITKLGSNDPVRNINACYKLYDNTSSSCHDIFRSK